MENLIISTLAARKKTIKSLSFTLLFLILTASSFAQPLRWMKTYDSGYNSDDEGRDICRSADGINFYVIGKMFVNGSGFCIGAIKINQYGDTLWLKVIGIDSATISFGLAVAPTPDGGCVLSGDWDEPFTLKLNPDGTTGWFKQYGPMGSYVIILHMEPTSDGGYIACGRTFGGAYILKINAVGDLLWQKEIYPNYSKKYYWVTEAIEGGYLTLSDSLLSSPINTRNIEITKWDINGNIQWKKIYPELYKKSPNVLKRISNGYILFGEAFDSIPGSDIKYTLYFSKLDLSYNVTSTKILRENKNIYYSSAGVINDNRYLFTSYSQTPFVGDTSFTYMSIVDSSGNYIHRKTLLANMPLINGYYFRSFTTASNGDIVLAGYSFLNNNGRSDVFLMRTDSNLALSPIGIQQTGNILPAEFTLYQNYPNPFNPTTTIKYDIPKDGFIALKIYDILGREVFSVNEFKKAGSHETVFDGSGFASGVYFYSIETNGLKQTKKMLMVK